VANDVNGDNNLDIITTGAIFFGKGDGTLGTPISFALTMREVIYVDLEKPQFAIPVVRVIVPGLEAMSEAPGYSPGPRAILRQEEQTWTS
jgi:hypothetical protein